ncbi:hypothetical protein EBM89_06275 [Cellulomonas triticagri]|uniref:Bacterial Ig-like domain-containing protein n=1 Tax=Cellulomonas triticagri TaxID=2483352 RepID=A0A3M2JLB0_9CELL|nr:hypothetical protein EBM89_06275 [Cellulomonas triticagri]
MLTALATGASLVALPVAPAAAAEGSAPAPVEKTVIGAVHSDAVSTFFEDGALVLGAKADVPERGTRYDEDDLWFHLAEQARTTLPTTTDAFDFIAPGGSDVWLAPITQDPALIWPGFSTESVPAGTFDGDTTFRLVDVEGPGDVELYLNGTTAPVGERLWSSDEDTSASDPDLKSFSRPSSGVHLHANWAFTAPGTYALTVEASAQRGGQTLSDTGVWTFVVGDLPEDVATQTTLAASTAQIAPGDAVTLTATVTPAVDGYVEFLDGSTVLGHEPVVAGTASFVTSSLGLGARSLTARYVPAVENLSDISTSAATTVTVAEDGQDEVLGIYGDLAYATGETIDLRIGGYDLADGERFRWILDLGELGSSYVRDADIAANGHFVRDATEALAGARLRAVVTPADAYTKLHETPAVTLEVTGENVGFGEALRITGIQDQYFRGDQVVAGLEGRAPAAGESVRWWTRTFAYTTTYGAPSESEGFQPTADGLTVPASSLYLDELVAQLVDDTTGEVLGQSPAVTTEVLNRHVGITGNGAAYRLGDVADVAAVVDPTTDDLRYTWYYVDVDPTSHQYTQTTLLETADASAQIEITQGLGDNGLLRLDVDRGSTGDFVGGASVPIRLTDAQPGEYDLFVGGLSDHYHQGWDIELTASAFPEASATDTYQWSWQLPRSDEFVDIEGATSATLDLVAEQALAGTRVRVEMFDAAGEPLATSEPGTIQHDDHGAAARQVTTVAAPADHYHSGDTVELTASVEPGTVFDLGWWVQKDGEPAPSVVVDGTGTPVTGDTLSFTATADLDGAAFVAQPVYPDGTPIAAYRESQPVTLVVDDHGTEPTPEPTDPGTSPEPTPEPTDPGTSPEPTPDPTDPGTTPEPAPEPTDPGTLPGTGEDRPATAPTPRTAADLGTTAPGGVTVSDDSPAAGQVVRVALGAEHAGEWVAAWMFSTPVLLGGGWTQADATGAITVRIPADAPAGDHRLAVFAADGTLLGWSALSVSAAPTAVGTTELAVTGSDALPVLWLWASALLVVGAVGVLVARQRRRPVAG